MEKHNIVHVAAISMRIRLAGHFSEDLNIRSVASCGDIVNLKKKYVYTLDALGPARHRDDN